MTVSRVKHSALLSVWGGVCSKGKTKLQFYKGTIGAKEYQQIIKKAVPEAKKLMGKKD